MSAAALLAQQPLLALGYCDRAVPASTPNLWAVKTWRHVEHVYNDRECDRCNGPKHIASETLWCAACHALPACDDCGMPEGECADGCGDAPCWSADPDRERFYTP